MRIKYSIPGQAEGMRAPQFQILGSRAGFGWERWSPFQNNLLGIIREHPGEEDWKVTSFLNALRGRGCSEGLGRCKSELKSPITFPRVLQELFQPFMDRDPQQGPALHVPVPLGRAELVLFCLSKDQVHFNLNKQELKVLQNPSRKLSASSLHLFSGFASEPVWFLCSPSVFSHLNIN